MIFVDSSAWFAAVNRRDHGHPRAIELLTAHAPLATSDFVLVETWLLINSRIDLRRLNASCEASAKEIARSSVSARTIGSCRP